MSRRAPGPRLPLLGSLGRRLAAAFLGIALVSIAVLVAVTLVLFDVDVGSTSREPETVYASALASGLRSAYLATGGWDGADLSPSLALARVEGVGLRLESGGHTVATVPGPSQGSPPRVLPLTADGTLVGTLSLTFPASGLTPAETNLRNSLVNAVVIAAVVAALLALSAGLVTSRRLVAPLRRLTSAVARLGSGDRSSRVGPIRAAGEIRQLAETFDAMAADLQSEDRLRRALVADVAHELRTPVAILRAELEAVSVGIRRFDPATVESLTEEVDRLSRLVEDLGVLAAAEAASLGLERTRVDVSVVAARAADRLASRVREADVRLERQLSPADVLGDPGRLEQVVINLLSNAVKFSPRKATVELAVSRRDGEVRLAVSDEGPGIPAEEQPRVFERFYRGQGAAGTPGSGVGLAVVAAIVSAHGGRVALESAPGRGTTFEVVLPAAPAD